MIMAEKQKNNLTNGHSIPHFDLSYDNANPIETSQNLAFRIHPKWREHLDELEIVKFTDGITNTLFKIARRAPGATQKEIDSDSVLMRAYGNNTDLIIDRDREAKSHALLAQRGMAPPLLGRFNNGLLYGYIPGKASTPQDLTREPVWRGVAGKLGEWHARVPIGAFATETAASSNGYTNGHHPDGVNGRKPSGRLLDNRNSRPDIWSVLQKWLDALSVATEKERARKELLQQELERSYRELDNKDGIGERGLIFGHCDLLSANVIMLPSPDATPNPNSVVPVTFIDYEYATPCPAAFDLANHFAEWAGYDLDFNKLPTRATRRGFLREYVAAYNRFASVKIDEAAVCTSLFEEVDRYRGMPGFYWGIWSLIQAKISKIDFDYAQYAEDRFSEYWAWRAAKDGSRAPEGKATPLRESRWNQEC